ncbi:MAG: flagellar basal body rod protein FlgC [Xanthomonadales bacterium]|nr:flagellar basal body rod protein FlgC [Xanthomonadales bacterium]
MSDFNIFRISGSALNAQSVRLNTIASNMANANVAAGSAADVFRARMPVFQATADPELNGARRVEVTDIIESTAEPIKQYSPGHPLSDDDGYIYKPNVNVVEQMADMISTSRSYQNNLEVMNTTKELMMQTLQLGR